MNLHVQIIVAEAVKQRIHQEKRRPANKYREHALIDHKIEHVRLRTQPSRSPQPRPLVKGHQHTQEQEHKPECHPNRCLNERNYSNTRDGFYQLDCLVSVTKERTQAVANTLIMEKEQPV
mgnify:CR=1 FL=1